MNQLTVERNQIQDTVFSLDVCENCMCVSECVRVGNKVVGSTGVGINAGCLYAPVFVCRNRDACERRRVKR